MFSVSLDIKDAFYLVMVCKVQRKFEEWLQFSTIPNDYEIIKMSCGYLIKFRIPHLHIYEKMGYSK